MLPVKQLFPQEILYAAEGFIFALEGQGAVHIQLVEGDLLNEHHRPDHLQVVYRPMEDPPFVVCLRLAGFKVLRR